jgi:hypothetical protein
MLSSVLRIATLSAFVGIILPFIVCVVVVTAAGRLAFDVTCARSASA